MNKFPIDETETIEYNYDMHGQIVTKRVPQINKWGYWNKKA
jgi:YD repeat-containing protein